MLIGYSTNVRAHRPLMDLLDGFLLSSNAVADHFGFGHDYMSALRKLNKGPPWIALPTGTIRYSAAEVFAWQIGGERGPLTLNRVTLAISSCASVPIEHRAAIIDHIEAALIETPKPSEAARVPRGPTDAVLKAAQWAPATGARALRRPVRGR